jgi:hypothetical protein
VTVDQEEQVKSREEIMEILEAFDLTKSFRDAGDSIRLTQATAGKGVMPLAR